MGLKRSRVSAVSAAHRRNSLSHGPHGGTASCTMLRTSDALQLTSGLGRTARLARGDDESRCGSGYDGISAHLCWARLCAFTRTVLARLGHQSCCLEHTFGSGCCRISLPKLEPLIPSFTRGETDKVTQSCAREVLSSVMRADARHQPHVCT